LVFGFWLKIKIFHRRRGRLRSTIKKAVSNWQLAKAKIKTKKQSAIGN
jgi:hypothetical protein